MADEENSNVILDDLVPRWNQEFLEDDAAVALARQRLLELGFAIKEEKIDRSVEGGDLTLVSWRLTRDRSSRPATEKQMRSIIERVQRVLGLRK